MNDCYRWRGLVVLFSRLSGRHGDHCWVRWAETTTHLRVQDSFLAGHMVAVLLAGSDSRKRKNTFPSRSVSALAAKVKQNRRRPGRVPESVACGMVSGVFMTASKAGGSKQGDSRNRTFRHRHGDGNGSGSGGGATGGCCIDEWALDGGGPSGGLRAVWFSAVCLYMSGGEFCR